MAEKVQKDMANLATIEQNVRKQMDKYGIALKDEAKPENSLRGIGGPSSV